MRLLRASMFTSRYRELVAAEGLALDAAPEPVDVACPRCGALYIADLDVGEEPWDLEALEWEAVVQLEEECPDHPYRFAVGP
jgi:hypothetical protein